jgi:hypothetical protein
MGFSHQRFSHKAKHSRKLILTQKQTDFGELLPQTPNLSPESLAPRREKSDNRNSPPVLLSVARPENRMGETIHA